MKIAELSNCRSRPHVGSGALTALSSSFAVRIILGFAIEHGRPFALKANGLAISDDLPRLADPRHRRRWSACVRPGDHAASLGGNEADALPRRDEAYAARSDASRTTEGAMRVKIIGEASGWRLHTVRGVIAGVLKKRLGLQIEVRGVLKVAGASTAIRRVMQLDKGRSRWREADSLASVPAAAVQSDVLKLRCLHRADSRRSAEHVRRSCHDASLVSIEHVVGFSTQDEVGDVLWRAGPKPGPFGPVSASHLLTWSATSNHIFVELTPCFHI